MGMSKTSRASDEPRGQLRHAQDPERDQLAGDELRARDRRDVELLQRAELLLARDVLRGEQRADDGDQRHQDAGHHVVPVVERGVVPAARPDVDACEARPRPGAAFAAIASARPSSLPSSARVVRRGCRRRTPRTMPAAAPCSAFSTSCTGALRSRIRSALEAGRDVQHHRGVAGRAARRPHAVHGGGGARHAEVRRRLEAGDELSRHGRAIEVHQVQRRLADLERRGEAEHQQLDHRDGQHLEERRAVAEDVQVLLPHEEQDGAHGQASRILKLRTLPPAGTPSCRPGSASPARGTPAHALEHDPAHDDQEPLRRDDVAHPAAAGPACSRWGR
jgi:hypothetical protein